MPRKSWVSALAAIAVLMAIALGSAARAAPDEEARTSQVLRTWYRLTLELVRHTPTYSPPVASRAFAYLGVAAFETAAGGRKELRSLAGQLNGLEIVPAPPEGAVLDDAVALQAALAVSVAELFGNTGPTGQRAIASVRTKLEASAADGVAKDVAAASAAYGRAVAEHILAWARGDGGAVVENMGFPEAYRLIDGPAHWVPTSLIAQQQTPLLPNWGGNRTFAMPEGATCGLPPPPEYGETADSAFYKEAYEVYATVNDLTPEQLAIARFWSDDPMLSPTPPGHWLWITLHVLSEEKADSARSVEALARMGIVLADAFIGCWNVKFQYDLVRPVTYIRRFIDPKWDALLNTPPFPEYPSGHSTQSAAAAEVLTALFGDNHAFVDGTHEDDGLPARSFPSFRAAAGEAGISRLYGGIHFRSAIERGLEQGRCIGAYTNDLRTRN